jgi:hypothetical protein
MVIKGPSGALANEGVISGGDLLCHAGGGKSLGSSSRPNQNKKYSSPM